MIARRIVVVSLLMIATTIAESLVADLVIFDPAAVSDRGTFEDPHQYPVGVPFVLVAGIPVVDDGVFTSRRPGVVLSRPPGRRTSSIGDPPSA